MGQVVQQYWDAIPTQLPLVELDKFVVMPNHVHGIVVITDIDHTVGSNVGAKNFSPLRYANHHMDTKRRHG